MIPPCNYVTFAFGAIVAPTSPTAGWAKLLPASWMAKIVPLRSREHYFQYKYLHYYIVFIDKFHYYKKRLKNPKILHVVDAAQHGGCACRSFVSKSLNLTKRSYANVLMCGWGKMIPCPPLKSRSWEKWRECSACNEWAHEHWAGIDKIRNVYLCDFAKIFLKYLYLLLINFFCRFLFYKNEDILCNTNLELNKKELLLMIDLFSLHQDSGVKLTLGIILPRVWGKMVLCPKIL